MKKKWMKILLIINMFLCLFGVQEFTNKTLEPASAASSTIYAEITCQSGNQWSNYYLYSWVGNNSGTDYLGKLVAGTTNLYEFNNVNTSHTNILFHKGIGVWDGTNQTENRENIGSINYFVVNPKGQWDKLAFDTSKEKTIKTFTQENIYFDLSEVGWDDPCIFMWADGTKLDSNSSWPGVKLSTISRVVGTNLYKVDKLTGLYTDLIISNSDVDDSNKKKTVNFKISDLGNNNCYKVLKEQDSDDYDNHKMTTKQVYEIKTDVDGVETIHYVSDWKDISNPTKDYYSFDGWYTEKEGGTKIDALSTSAFPNYSGTVYAHFTRNKKQLTVIDDGKTENKTVDEGTTIQENVSPKGKDGYTFSHWSTSLDGPQISDNLIKDNMTIYAVYEINKYTVTYQYMTGLTGGPSLGTEKVEHGKTITKANPTWNGYKFMGWFTDANCTTAFDKTTPITSTKTIYAKFVAAYTVSYYDGNDILFTELCIEGGKISHTEGPEKTGYTFKYWCTDSALTTKYDNNAVITSDLTLYAKYDINTYTVTLNKNNGENPTTIDRDHGEAIGTLPTPTKTGWDFEYWAWDSEKGTKVEPTDTITSDRTVCAVYTIQTYTITLNKNNGEDSSAINKNYGEAIGTLPTPTKTGWDFQYWAWDSEKGTKVEPTDTITSDRTVCAVYTIQTYTVTFKLDDESVHDTIYVNYGSAIGTQLPNDPEKTGYTFTGWKLSNGTAITSDSVITSDCTVYANFNINSYTVTFHYGENVNTTSSKTLNYNTELKVSEFGVDTSWADHHFAGWYYDAGYTRLFNEGDRLSGNIDLYAKYSESSYRYVYVDGSKLTDCFIDSNTYVHMYSDSAGTTWPGTKENVTYIGNKIVRIKVDTSIYSHIIVNNGVEKSTNENHGKQTGNIELSDNVIYYSITNTYINENNAYVYSFTSETVPANLLKAQVANISGDLDMYRFTMGATNDALYGFEFVFIKDAPSNSDIRYWNFSKESMLTQVRFGVGDANLYKTGTLYNGLTYDGYYSLTIKETSSFKLTNYDRVLVLACCKDNTGVNVIKAVEYSINKTSGALSRMA